MVMQIEPIDRAISLLKSQRDYDEVIFTTPDGEQFTQSLPMSFPEAEYHYPLRPLQGDRLPGEEHLVTREISIGDFVLTGGELVAAMIADAVVRVIPGAIGDEQSALSDSFQDGLLAPPVYTRPAEYKGWKVPEVLISGHERKIAEWRHEQSVERTKRLRPDLLR